MWGYNKVTFETGNYSTEPGGVYPDERCGKKVGDRRGACIPFEVCEGTRYLFISDDFGAYLNANECGNTSDYETQSEQEVVIETQKLSDYECFKDINISEPTEPGLCESPLAGESCGDSCCPEGWTCMNPGAEAEIACCPPGFGACPPTHCCGGSPWNVCCGGGNLGPAGCCHRELEECVGGRCVPKSQ